MKGRICIDINNDITIEELFELLKRRCGGESISGLTLGKPNPLSHREFILLPGTESYIVIAYPRGKRIILGICENAAAVSRRFAVTARRGIMTSAASLGMTIALRGERKRAETLLHTYAGSIQGALLDDGLLYSE